MSDVDSLAFCFGRILELQTDEFSSEMCTWNGTQIKCLFSSWLIVFSSM